YFTHDSTLAALLLVCVFGMSAALAVTDISGKYIGTTHGFAINASDGQYILPPADANISMTIEQNGHLLKAEAQMVGMSNEPVGETYYMVGAIGNDDIVFYYAGLEKMMGESALVEALSMGEVNEETGEIILGTVGGGYDEEDNLIFTWVETDELTKVVE
ncbi:MAG: hypothetical protein D4Q77_03930, partial [Methanothrix sp.]